MAANNLPDVVHLMEVLALANTLSCVFHFNHAASVYRANFAKFRFIEATPTLQAEDPPVQFNPNMDTIVCFLEKRCRNHHNLILATTRSTRLLVGNCNICQHRAGRNGSTGDS